MVKVEVRLFAHLRQGREKTQTMEVKEGTTILDIIKALNIDKDEVAIMLLNGRDGPETRQVKDGDVVSLFPPVGGG
ncbi:MAG: MoaD/ThiS family protein [Tissierellia bacterium]|nr:MoaD/ThiS family protein [Tissierellia bacterium]